MHTPTRIENIAAAFRSLVYRCIKGAWLWSIKQESLDDYVEELLLHELIYSDGSFAARVLKEYIAGNESYWKEKPQPKRALENLIEAIEAMNGPADTIEAVRVVVKGTDPAAPSQVEIYITGTKNLSTILFKPDVRLLPDCFGYAYEGTVKN